MAFLFLLSKWNFACFFQTEKKLAEKCNQIFYTKTCCRVEGCDVQNYLYACEEDLEQNHTMDIQCNEVIFFSNNKYQWRN